jgi:hypothetical protein
MLPLQMSLILDISFLKQRKRYPEVNRKNSIISTIDFKYRRCLSLRLVIPEVIKLQKKREEKAHKMKRLIIHMRIPLTEHGFIPFTDLLQNGKTSNSFESFLRFKME